MRGLATPTLPLRQVCKVTALGRLLGLDVVLKRLAGTRTATVSRLRQLARVAVTLRAPNRGEAVLGLAVTVLHIGRGLPLYAVKVALLLT